MYYVAKQIKSSQGVAQVFADWKDIRHNNQFVISDSIIDDMITKLIKEVLDTVYIY